MKDICLNLYIRGKIHTVLTVRKILDFEALVSIVKVNHMKVLLLALNSVHLNEKKTIRHSPTAEESYEES